MIGVGLMMTAGMVIYILHFAVGNMRMLLASGGLILVRGYCGGFLRLRERLLARAARRADARRQDEKYPEGGQHQGYLLAVGGGIMASGYFPLVNMAREGENGLGPYALGIFFAIGLGISTLFSACFL